MNRKFWRWVEKLASDKLAKDEAKANWIGMKNEFNQTRNEIHEAWKFNGDLLVQRVVEQMNTRFSDVNVVTRDMLDDRSVGIKAFVERGNSLMMSTLGRIFVNVHGLETKVGDWFAQLVRGDEELARQAEVHHASHYELYTQLGEELRHLRMKVDEHQSLNYKTLLALHNDLVSRIQSSAVPQAKEHFDSAPTKEWLMDHLDEIIQMADVAKAVRDNTAPRENTIYKLVGAMRTLNLWGVTDLRDEIVSKINSWDNDQSNVQRLHA